MHEARRTDLQVEQKTVKAAGSSVNRRDIVDAESSMLVKNPAPDSSPSRNPSETLTLAISC
ncbi:hypothetical protein FJ959_08505 [Mesorhizobium sp. B2-2-4]|uniref:hypothetical protein n=1 Tax=unclassified Mesorhizobium TaxID=325217 RepID=UPI00112DA63F|nr:MULTISPECIES: hypothetical protein [unclassified Mesorhizobium]TPM58907.1 hypothetical protein FJ959_08505 [Mesorhizobium sp. B2-2-4]TPM67391.1 hypothetical protein FJ965_09645 [Mesorhizobium sp. B2-2-1]TPN62462.1 hypothetical protein FJ984_25465 [Mesorhizobium sp. B1-1-3]